MPALTNIACPEASNSRTLEPDEQTWRVLGKQALQLIYTALLLTSTIMFFEGLRAGEYCRAQGEDVFERGREPCVQLELLREQYARIGQAYQIQRGSYIRKDSRTWQKVLR